MDPDQQEHESARRGARSDLILHPAVNPEGRSSEGPFFISGYLMNFILDATANSRLTMHEHGDGTGMIVQSTDVSAALAPQRSAAPRRHDQDR
jgi:hypothetical protein